MKLQIKAAGLKGIFSFKAVNVHTNEERDLGITPNMITDSGLDLIGAGYLASKCAVGTSSNPVQKTDIGLGNKVAETTSFHNVNSGHWETGVNTVGTPFYWGRNTFRFAQGVAAGNLTEVGIFGSDNKLFSRALIVDALNRPTTLSILEDEYLDVTYELRIYPYLEDTILTVEIENETGKHQHTCTCRAADTASPIYYNHYMSSIANYTGSNNFAFSKQELQHHTGSPERSYGMIPRKSSYQPGSKSLTFLGSAGLDFANFEHGIKSIVLDTSKGSFQIGIDPPIMKDNFTITGAEIEITWDRYVE